MKRMTKIPESDRPREKIVRKGPQALTDPELIAVLIGTGTAKRDVLKVARDVHRRLDLRPGPWSMSNLRAITGLGKAKSCQIVAAYELARRRFSPTGRRVTGPESLLPYISFIADKRQEYLVCVSLNGAAEILNCRVVTIGLLDSTSVHPREVFADPLSDRAASVVLAHNHPSGVPSPSRRDLWIHRRLAQAGRLLGIDVLDHLILTSNAFYSFKKHGLS